MKNKIWFAGHACSLLPTSATSATEAMERYVAAKLQGFKIKNVSTPYTNEDGKKECQCRAYRGRVSYVVFAQEQEVL